MKCEKCKKELSGSARLLKDGTTLCNFCHDYEMALQQGGKYLETGNIKSFFFKTQIEGIDYFLKITQNSK